eukprot:CAMPEP_0194485068 /NCGR_PEP_ID=MMETSP0253-20130528/6189_1 /TAXON_ID=2966 /ORGANISM="Noctiluca scintillans" /LENGTH=345 /DNA_ID=CAMNT_0039324989 /DNA_START=1 /DNA_END=1034 /DNA_ORIENTATION=+
MAKGVKRPVPKATVTKTEEPSDFVVPGQMPKAPRIDGDAWTCPSCGNLNYEGRTVCNLRRCGKPRPVDAWICPCGNQNSAGRLFCNLRYCGLAKPGLTKKDFEARSPTLVGVPQVATVAQFRAPTVPASTVPQGSWVCATCRNVNYPDRDRCNGKRGSCGLPRPLAVLQQPVQMFAAPALTLNSTTSPPPGSWICIACNNLNFPTRTTCNGRNCGRARAEVDGGGPGSLANMHTFTTSVASAPEANVGTVAPEGSWVCLACNNLNFPNRTTCNGRNCGRARAEVDAGGPEVLADLQQFGAAGLMVPETKVEARNTNAAPEGSWVCLACNNVNFPNRTTCNGRNCG